MLLVLMMIAITVFGGMILTIARRQDGHSDRELREMRERLLRLEQSVETMTSDMERVAESQRFMTALLEDRGRGQGALRPPPPPASPPPDLPSQASASVPPPPASPAAGSPPSAPQPPASPGESVPGN